jgi:hypothetical protein
MWLQSKYRFAEGCLLRADESLGPPLLKAELAVIGSPSGSFGMVESELAYFYRWKGVLTFRLGHARPIRLTDRISTSWSVAGKNGRFTIECDEGMILEKSFALCPDTLNIELDPTAFAEAEDFEFLLFVHNVQSSSERRALIYC